MRLSEMDNEIEGGISSEKLIFPKKVQKDGPINRISEQELRLLFIEEFKEDYKNLFYSVETPTEKKYKFGIDYSHIVKNRDVHKTSASLDLCVFERNPNKEYYRILNIEFKHKKSNDKNIGKDILKLLREPQDGAFIQLLKNTDRGTFRNNNKTGIFDILHKSFLDFKSEWFSENKTIHLIILSLEKKKDKLLKPIMLYCEIGKSDLNKLDDIFYVKKDCGNIREIEEGHWKIDYLKRLNS